MRYCPFDIGKLAPVAKRIVLGGVLESRKGKGGGFSLARPPGEISFESVLRAVNAYPDSGRCAFGWGNCDHEHPCPLHTAWSRFNDAVWRWATETTLADVTRYDEETLAKLHLHRDVPGDE